MRRGFTLIEVLVALAIAAIGLGAALSVVTNAASNTSYLRDRVLASWIAGNLITEMRLGPNLPDLNRANGTVEFAGRKWRWDSTVTQTQVDGLRRIEVSVRDVEATSDTPLAQLSGFAGRTALEGSVATAGDPYDPTQAGQPGGAPVVPATPAITTKASHGGAP
jgi:general secretion pathway protein I